jgi:hypothetical protein
VDGLEAAGLSKKTERTRPSSALSGTKQAAAAYYAFYFALVAQTRTSMRGNKEHTCAAKESGDGSDDRRSIGMKLSEKIESSSEQK